MLGGSGNPEEVKRLMKRFGLRGPISVWSRTDLGSKCFRTTLKNGPDWKNVRVRITHDARTGHVIDVEQAWNMPKQDEHRLLPGGKRDITTTLLYVDDS